MRIGTGEVAPELGSSIVVPGEVTYSMTTAEVDSMFPPVYSFREAEPLEVLVGQGLFGNIANVKFSPTPLTWDDFFDDFTLTTTSTTTTTIGVELLVPLDIDSWEMTDGGAFLDANHPDVGARHEHYAFNMTKYFRTDVWNLSLALGVEVMCLEGLYWEDGHCKNFGHFNDSRDPINTTLFEVARLNETSQESEVLRVVHSMRYPFSTYGSYSVTVEKFRDGFLYDSWTAGDRVLPPNGMYFLLLHIDTHKQEASLRVSATSKDGDHAFVATTGETPLDVAFLSPVNSIRFGIEDMKGRFSFVSMSPEIWEWDDMFANATVPEFFSYRVAMDSSTFGGASGVSLSSDGLAMSEGVVGLPFYPPVFFESADHTNCYI